MTSELRCVFFGDSITAGQYVSPSRHWTTLLAERLSDLESTHVLYSVGAVSGDTTRQGLERFPTEVQSMRPHVITIQFGLNDCNRWQTDGGLSRVSELAFEANLLEMIGRARRFGTTQVILCTNHPTLRTTTFEDGATYEDCRRRYNEIVRHVAHDADVVLFDVDAEFAPLEPRLAELLMEPPDVLHLSAAGHAVYADLLEPVLREALLAARRTAGEGPLPPGAANAVEREASAVGQEASTT
jgi:lysophospholipase L1-like esterase